MLYQIATLNHRVFMCLWNIPIPSDIGSIESTLQYEMMRSWSLVIYMLLVLQSGCHKRWSSNEVTSSPLKFQTATVRFLKVRNNWFSYRNMNAEGVMNSVRLTSVISTLRTYINRMSDFKGQKHHNYKRKQTYINNLEILILLLD